MKNLKHYFTLACGMVLLSTLSSSPATGQTITEIQVTNDAFFQQLPAISGNRIVWEDTRNGANPDIFMFDALTLTETQITTTVGGHFHPDISANRIVWRDFSTGRSEIFMHDLEMATTTQITNDVTNQLTVAIDGTRIVWYEQDESPPFARRLVVRDLAGGAPTLIPSMPSGTPAIAGHLVVWADNRAGNTDIFLFNLNTNTETRITNHSADQQFPDISGNRIVWEDRRNGNWDIFTYDISTATETQITTDPADQQEPAISGNRIVWQDRRTGNLDIFLYDLLVGTEQQLTSDPGADFMVDIDGDRIVWVSIRNGQRDIFLGEILLTLEVTIDIKPSSDPNCFNNNDAGVIPVAILGSAELDVTNIDPGSVKLEGLAVKAVGKIHKLLANIEDVDGDGLVDLVVRIEDTDGAFSSGSETATLTGSLYDGTPIEGTDEICVVP